MKEGYNPQEDGVTLFYPDTTINPETGDFITEWTRTPYGNAQLIGLGHKDYLPTDLGISLVEGQYVTAESQRFSDQGFVSLQVAFVPDQPSRYPFDVHMLEKKIVALRGALRRPDVQDPQLVADRWNLPSSSIQYHLFASPNEEYLRHLQFTICSRDTTGFSIQTIFPE